MTNLDFNKFVWECLPETIPGEIYEIWANNAGKIRLAIKLNYPNGKPFYEAYCANLSRFKEGEKVLFTIKPAKKAECEKQNQPNLMAVDRITKHAISDAEFEDAKSKFKGELIAQTLKSAEGKEEQAADRLTEVNEKLRKADLDIEEKIEARIAPIRQQLKHELKNVDTDRIMISNDRKKLEKQRIDLERREQEIAPYKTLIRINLPKANNEQPSMVIDDLAGVWASKIQSYGGSVRSDIAIAFLLSTIAATYSGSIILLNGSVGVGKTSLISRAARALGGKHDVIPVRPAWIDPSDLIGFFDPINNTFRPTSFTTALRETDEDQLHFICLDELNLAKVENYGADLLSCLEYSRSREKLIHGNDAGDLKLYSKDIERQLWSEARDLKEAGEKGTREEVRRLNIITSLLERYPSQISIPHNMVLVGTLNSDETTYDLSPKMIDRSYIITFPSVDFHNVTTSKEIRNEAQARLNISELITRIDTAINTPANLWSIVVEWNTKLDQLGLPLGYRVKRDYDIFRSAGAVVGISEADCLGYFLFCKILPRIFFFKNPEKIELCKQWLNDLKDEFGKFGPISVIDAMLEMCDDERASTVRYWNK